MSENETLIKQVQIENLPSDLQKRLTKGNIQILTVSKDVGRADYTTIQDAIDAVGRPKEAAGFFKAVSDMTLASGWIDKMISQLS